MEIQHADQSHSTAECRVMQQSPGRKEICQIHRPQRRPRWSHLEAGFAFGSAEVWLKMLRACIASTCNNADLIGLLWSDASPLNPSIRAGSYQPVGSVRAHAFLAFWG